MYNCHTVSSETVQINKRKTYTDKRNTTISPWCACSYFFYDLLKKSNKEEDRSGSPDVTARVWCRGRIDRKRNSTINLTTDSGACYLCLPQISPLTPDVTTNNFFHSAAGNAKIYLKNYNIIPRLTLLMETFIHTYHRSFTVLSDKSIYTVSLPWKLSDFLDTSFSWTLSFPQGPYFSSFFSGDRYLFHLPQFVGLQPTDTTRLISGHACLGVSTIKSAALTSPPPRVNLLVPVPAATFL